MLGIAAQMIHNTGNRNKKKYIGIHGMQRTIRSTTFVGNHKDSAIFLCDLLGSRGILDCFPHELRPPALAAIFETAKQPLTWPVFHVVCFQSICRS